MLSLDRQPLAVRTSPATIIFSDEYGREVGSKPATFVEYFYGSTNQYFGSSTINEVKRFVLSADSSDSSMPLPLIANPVLKLEYGVPTGRLIAIGSNYVKSIKVSRYHEATMDQE